MRMDFFVIIIIDVSLSWSDDASAELSVCWLTKGDRMIDILLLLFNYNWGRSYSVFSFLKNHFFYLAAGREVCFILPG